MARTSDEVMLSRWRFNSRHNQLAVAVNIVFCSTDLHVIVSTAVGDGFHQI